MTMTTSNEAGEPDTIDEVRDIPRCVELLLHDRWDAAYDWLCLSTDGALRPDKLSTDRDEVRATIDGIVETLFARGEGEMALAWQMMTADPTRPRSFLVVMPQLQYALDNCPTIADPAHAEMLKRRLAVWWAAAAGGFKDSEVSIFRIAAVETANGSDIPRDFYRSQKRSPANLVRAPGPGVVVLPSATATKLSLSHEFHALIDAMLRLVAARDVAYARRTLLAEYPHAQAAVDLIVRDLREGQPVRLKPILIVGEPGCGKSRIVRRLGELLAIKVHRFDGAGSHDGMFGGSPKAWSGSTASVPARAVNGTKIANPILMVDEIDKAASGAYNGRLWDALVPFLERETSQRFRDPGIDAEMDLSWISHVATANDATVLPAPLLDRYRIVRMPAPTMAHLPDIATVVLDEIAGERDAAAFTEPLADDELEVIGRAWKRAGLSIRNLQKIVGATLDARDATAPRH